MTESDKTDPNALSHIEKKTVRTAIRERIQRVESKQDAIRKTSDYPGKQDDLDSCDVEIARLRRSERKIVRDTR